MRNNGFSSAERLVVAAILAIGSLVLLGLPSSLYDKKKSTSRRLSWPPAWRRTRGACTRLARSGGGPPHGLTLVEVLVALAIAAILVAGLGGVVGQSLQTWTFTRERHDLTRQARFAMDRMVAAVSGSTRLILPLAENPVTAQSESIRDVLAVTLDPALDRDGDGFADADNDKDARVDEDLPADNTKDGASGIVGIDDNNDGAVDEAASSDDDEDATDNEDPFNGMDDDGDGAVDEDSDEDTNDDSQPGVAGVDDDIDGLTDEGSFQDDDEDGSINEDWLDPVVYFLSGTTLMERIPNLDPADGSDFTESPIADNVSQFRVERLASGANDRAVLLEITLELTGPSGTSLSLSSRVGVGDAP